MPKPFDCVDHNKLWRILQEMGIPDHLTCLLRNLYAGQEATVRIGCGPTDWFQIGKGICQGYILSPCLFNLHEEYIMRNTGLDETQAGIRIAGRNCNNLRHARRSKWPLQYSCLENPMDRGAWQAMVHRVTESQTLLKRLSMHADMQMTAPLWQKAKKN